ncbi:ABC transporter [Alkalibacterium gilvum]|uniref:ABC transporter n=1 Tax=Alkalibacterium gilvum TaxID=1130080 RepID=A0A1H6UBA7_9LACT|nr:ABC transporter [Alkalibacterium gilvum]
MLKVENISKSFEGHFANKDISFDISEGKTLGIIGQNGSGKTTIFRIILGFLDQDSGVIKWGKPFDKKIFLVK